MPRVDAPIRIEQVAPEDDPEVSDMLVQLALEEQDHYDHPQETEEEVRSRLRHPSTFIGENHILVARDTAPVGLCWIVLYDPGTGLEAEVAELYVRPEARGRGVATALLGAALALLRERQVTFASVWTRTDNPAALAAYHRAGFQATRQTVLTWLPLPPTQA